MRVRLLIAAVLVVALAMTAAPAFAAAPAPSWIPPAHVPIIIPPFGEGVWAEDDGSTEFPFIDDVLVQATDPSPSEPWIPPYRVFPVGRQAYVTQGWVGAIYGQVKNVPLQVATYCDITGPDGFHQHWDPADTAGCWVGPHPWDPWWEAWLGMPAPALFNPAARAGVYFNHLWLPVGPFPVAGTYHLTYGQYQLLPTVDMLEWYGVWRPVHLGPDEINWEIEYDFTVG